MIKEQINIPYFSLRILTLACYFLPFIFFLSTCTGGITTREAFNNEEALINEKEKLSDKLSVFDELTQQIDSSSNNSLEVLREIRLRINERSDNAINLKQDLDMKALCPTAYSLSGLGAVCYHKNIIARIILGASIFLSFITCILWRILRKRKLSLLLISANIITVFFFIIVSFATDVSVLYGSWILLFLLLIQLLTELQTSKLTPF